MGKKLVSRTAKVLSETKKTKDKEAVAIAYEHIPRNPREQEHGSIYAVIEVEDTGGHAEEIAEQIIDVLHNEYYGDTEKDPLESFESSLAKINEALAERSSEGQIHWLGKLNAVLAVLTESMIHVTQSGKAEAYLYRGEHVMHITEDLAGDSVNPLRTFINIASGELSEGDRMTLVTPGIFHKLSKSELKKFATDSSPIQAAENISRIISGESGSKEPNAVLILEMTSPEILAASAEEENEKTSTEVWVTPETKPINVATEQTLHGAAKVFDFLGKAVSGASAFVVTRAYPVVKKGVKNALATAKEFRKEKDAERIIIESEERIEHPNNNYADIETDLDDGILANPKEEGFEREIRIKAEHKPKILSLERFDFSFLSKAKDSINHTGRKISLPRGKGSIVYLAGAAIIVVALVGYFVYNSTVTKQKTEAENLFAQAKTKYEQAISDTASGNRTEAVANLETAEKLANDVIENKYKKEEAEALLSQIAAAKDQAMGIIRNSASEYFNFEKGTLGNMFTDGKIFYAMSYDNGSVYSLDPASKSSSVVVAEPDLGNSKVKFATLVVKRKTIVAYTETKEIYEIDLVSKKTTKQTVSGGLEDAVAIASYNTSIYLLSPSNNQIYKHISTSSGYGQKTGYISSPATSEVQNGISLAIDSDVYVISSDGFIKKYTSGKRQDYNPNNLPENISNPSMIYADTTAEGQYIVSSNNKLIRIDKNQNFAAQYVSDSVKDIKGIIVSDDTKTIYVLSEGKIYSIAF